MAVAYSQDNCGQNTAEIFFQHGLSGNCRQQYRTWQNRVNPYLMLKTEYDVPLSRSVSALSIERVMDLVSLLIIMTLGILFLSTSISISFILPALVAVIIVLIFFFFVTIFTPYWISIIERFLFIFVRKENARKKYGSS